MDADVVVIGAGALGLSTALHCALAGRSVIVLDRLQAGSQASGRAAGLFKSVQADELRTRLARRSIELALGFANWAGEPLEVERSGSFLLARTQAHADYLRRELAQSAGWGVDLEAASLARLGEQVSYCAPAGEGYALWCPEDVYIEEPISLVQAYAAACRRHGAEVAEDEPVVGIEVTGGQVRAVQTERRRITSGAVVDAAGAWVAQLASLAYDAVSLVALLAQGPAYHRFTTAALNDPNGFSGVHGIFRFQPDGTSERGLAVLEMTSSGPVVVSPAPTTFQKPGA